MGAKGTVTVTTIRSQQVTVTKEIISDLIRNWVFKNYECKGAEVSFDSYDIENVEVKIESRQKSYE